MPGSAHNVLWPELPYEAWKDTSETLHLWTQIAGKIRLALTPWLNHSWHVPLYVTARGLNTSPIPYAEGTFEIEFDFNSHLLRIMTGDGRERRIPLQPRSVAEFYELVIVGPAPPANRGQNHQAAFGDTGRYSLQPGPHT